MAYHKVPVFVSARGCELTVPVRSKQPVSNSTQWSTLLHDCWLPRCVVTNQNMLTVHPSESKNTPPCQYSSQVRQACDYRYQLLLRVILMKLTNRATEGIANRYVCPT